MKREWSTPNAVIEGFQANEYCAACWGVRCEVDIANAWEENHHSGPGITHRDEYCGHTYNNYLKDYENDHIIDAMIERNTDGLGEIPCTVYTDDTYTVVKDIKTVKPGDYIYWTSEASDGRVWHHQGKTLEAFPSHPNRS